jgi:crotonobetainyl-CoA:carnitine CoA-transferase CaiB-like acyl-CoA transferase
MWYRFGMCDTANAMYSVHAVLLALYHREKTGEGQLVQTNIINNGPPLNSDFFLTKDGPSPRPVIDKEQRGLSATYRLYQTKKGWIQLAAVKPAHWQALVKSTGLPEPATDRRYASAKERDQRRDELSNIFEPVFMQRTAEEWFQTLDAAGVPVEVSSETYGEEFFTDPDAAKSGWIVEYDVPMVGKTKQFGTLMEFSETPGRIFGPPPMLRGQHTKEILRGIGVSDTEIARLKAEQVVAYPER